MNIITNIKKTMLMLVIFCLFLVTSCSLNEYLSPVNAETDDIFGLATNVLLKIEKKSFDIGDVNIVGYKNINYIKYNVKVSLSTPSEKILKIRFINKSTQKNDYELTLNGSNSQNQFKDNGQFTPDINFLKNFKERNYTLLFESSHRINIYAEM